MTITDPADPHAPRLGHLCLRCAAAAGPEPLGAAPQGRRSRRQIEAVEAYLALRARTLLIAGTDRDQNTALAPCDQSSRPYLEADVSHTAESVFQIAFEEIYSSDASTWHLQFHGNADLRCMPGIDVFLSNGVQAADRPATLYALAANIAAASTAAAPGGPVLTGRRL